MAEPKTKPTGASVEAFLAAVPDPVRRADAQVALTLLTEVTGEPGVMWGEAIVGFGAYDYVGSNRKPARWPIIAFSPRKAELVMYIMPGFTERAALLARLGKHRVGGSCLYLKRLAEIDLTVLRELCAASVATMRERYPAASG